MPAVTAPTLPMASVLLQVGPSDTSGSSSTSGSMNNERNERERHFIASTWDVLLSQTPAPTFENAYLDITSLSQDENTQTVGQNEDTERLELPKIVATTTTKGQNTENIDDTRRPFEQEGVLLLNLLLLYVHRQYSHTCMFLYEWEKFLFNIQHFLCLSLFLSHLPLSRSLYSLTHIYTHILWDHRAGVSPGPVVVITDHIHYQGVAAVVQWLQSQMKV